MNSPSPLLNFKERAFNSSEPPPQESHYDLALGYWVCKDGKPLIKKMIEENNDVALGQTTKTATRESIDQVESVFAQTTATKTRESVENSESSSPFPDQTTITRTREGVDQVESASSFAQTRITETREAADRSERVA